MPMGDCHACNKACPEIRYLGDVQRLELNSDDVLVVSLAVSVSPDGAARIREHLTQTIGERPILILPDGMRLGVLASKG